MLISYHLSIIQIADFGGESVVHTLPLLPITTLILWWAALRRLVAPPILAWRGLRYRLSVAVRLVAVLLLATFAPIRGVRT